MLFRLVFFLVLAVLLYKLARFIWGRPKNIPYSGAKPQVHDELVKDPVCGIYLPKSQAKPLFLNGKTFHFCSEECKQKFSLEEHGRNV
ncbi:MAG: YHS domain-containing protein [Dissulfuribacterales bacterium]